MDSGGAESPHLQELKEFTTSHVNPKLRKLRDETYSVACQYPEPLAKLRSASIKLGMEAAARKGLVPRASKHFISFPSRRKRLHA